MKKIVSPDIAEGEAQSASDDGSHHGVLHPWSIDLISHKKVVDKRNICGFVRAFKKARCFLGRQIKGCSVTQVDIKGNPDLVPAKYRDGFKDGVFTLTLQGA